MPDKILILVVIFLIISCTLSTVRRYRPPTLSKNIYNKVRWHAWKCTCFVACYCWSVLIFCSLYHEKVFLLSIPLSYYPYLVCIWLKTWFSGACLICSVPGKESILAVNQLNVNQVQSDVTPAHANQTWQVRDVGARARAWALAKAPVNQFLPWEQEKEVYTTFDNFWALKTHKKSIIRRKAKSQKQDKHLKSPKNQTSPLNSRRQVSCREAERSGPRSNH